MKTQILEDGSIIITQVTNEDLYYDENGIGHFINWPDGVKIIGKLAFRYCKDLASIIIPAGMTSIRDNAFWSCKKLESITIPNSVISIGNGAFEGCINLTAIKIPTDNPEEFERVKNLIPANLQDKVIMIDANIVFDIRSAALSKLHRAPLAGPLNTCGMNHENSLLGLLDEPTMENINSYAIQSTPLYKKMQKELNALEFPHHDGRVDWDTYEAMSHEIIDNKMQALRDIENGFFKRIGVNTTNLPQPE